MTDPLKKAIKTIVSVANPDKIILFGSRVTGKQRAESDYDLLVIKRNLKNQRKLVQDIYLRFKNIGAPVDVLAIDMDRFEELKNDPYMVYHEAYQKGKVVHEKSPKGKRVVKTGEK